MRLHEWNKLVKNLTIFLFLMHLFHKLSNIEINLKQKCTNIFLQIQIPLDRLLLMAIILPWNCSSVTPIKWHANFNIPCLSSDSRWIVVSIKIRMVKCSNIEIISKMITKHLKLLISCSWRHAKLPLSNASSATRTSLLMLQVLATQIMICSNQLILT